MNCFLGLFSTKLTQSLSDLTKTLKTPLMPAAAYDLTCCTSVLVPASKLSHRTKAQYGFVPKLSHHGGKTLCFALKTYFRSVLFLWSEVPVIAWSNCFLCFSERYFYICRMCTAGHAKMVEVYLQPDSYRRQYRGICAKNIVKGLPMFLFILQLNWRRACQIWPKPWKPIFAVCIFSEAKCPLLRETTVFFVFHLFWLLSRRDWRSGCRLLSGCPAHKGEPTAAASEA